MPEAGRRLGEPSLSPAQVLSAAGLGRNGAGRVEGLGIGIWHWRGPWPGIEAEGLAPAPSRPESDSSFGVATSVPKSAFLLGV